MRDVTLAWHTVRIWAVTQAKGRLPSLVSQLPDASARSGRQTAGQLSQTLQVLSGQYGVPLRKRKKVTRG